MIRDITIGQFYQTDSSLHKMDPRTKIIGTFLFVVSVFLVKSIPALMLLSVFLVSVIAMSKVPLSFILRGMKAILFIMLFTAFFHLLCTGGDTIISYKFINITKQGISNAVKMVIRITYLVLGSSLMTLTTTPNNLTDGLESVFKPLNIIRVPVHDLAMMMSIALRFIPILLEETDKIMKAQMARGADFETGNIFVRAKNMLPLLVPLFVSAFRRANDLALAMEARCYQGGDKRTKMKPLRYKKIDVIAYVVLALFLVGVILLNRIVIRVW